MSDTKIQESQRTPSRIIARKTIPRYIIFKLQKNKDEERILKEAGTKNPYPQRNKGKNSSTSPQKPCKQEESRVKYIKY